MRKKRVSFEMFAQSQYAIREYIDNKGGNEYMHEARVLISSKGETKYNRILEVVSKIETNDSFVNIIGDNQFVQDYYETYTNAYQSFSFINNTLLIKGEDRSGNPIEINITNV